MRFKTALQATQINEPGDHHDERTPLLYLRVRDSGSKSWCLIYKRKGSGKQIRITLGVYPDEYSLADARDLARF